MNAVSVCDGISAAAVACAGLDYKFLLLAEIDKFPRAVLRHRHGAVDQRRYRPEHSIAGRPVLWGDFTALRPRHLRRLHGHADVDVLFGGTPCQSFSVAGKRAGLDDPRGDLSLEFALLAYRLGVRWFLWENVPGVLSSAEGRDFAAILSAFTGRVVEVPRDGWQTAGSIPDAGAGQFGVAWRTFDAQYAGVPQRRRRVFVVGHLGDWRRAAAVLFERHSLSGHPAPRREKGQGATYDVAPCLGASGRGFERTGDTRGQDCLVAFGGNNCAGPIDVATAVNACGTASGRMDFESESFIVSIQGTATRENPDSGPDGVGVREDGIAYTLEVQAVAFRTSPNCGAWETGDRTDALTTGTDRTSTVVGAMNLRGREGGAMPELDDVASIRAASGGSSRRYVATTMALRRLTPRERERLQGFPDDYTKISTTAADGPRYKALGNSWAVPCARWIVERIQAVEMAMEFQQVGPKA